MADKSKLDEFGLIAELLAPLADNEAADGLTDDAARVAVPQGHELVISTDTLVAGVHFPEHGDAALVANRLLACNISDLAAKGATPFGCLLTLGVAETWDGAFVTSFVEAFGQGLKAYGLQLWGGDTVRSQTTFVGLTVHGLVPHGSMLTRGGAQDGDDVYVTGTIGDAFLDMPESGAAYAAPTPPLAFGLGLRGLAHAAVDVSDGLLADLDHMCRASGGGMVIEAAAIPLSEAGRSHGNLAELVGAGDDLEIAFTASQDKADALTALAEHHGIGLTRIGSFQKAAAPQAVLRDADGADITPQQRGFRHF